MHYLDVLWYIVVQHRKGRERFTVGETRTALALVNIEYSDYKVRSAFRTLSHLGILTLKHNHYALNLDSDYLIDIVAALTTEVK